MDVIQPHLEFLLRHVLVVVFVAFLVEAAGVPFPSRMILLVAATVAIDARQASALVVVGTAGSVIGDHVPYVGGALMGPSEWPNSSQVAKRPNSPGTTRPPYASRRSSLAIRFGRARALLRGGALLCNRQRRRRSRGRTCPQCRIAEGGSASRYRGGSGTTESRVW